ncbi:MAG: lysophospholipid acyltransferase family protein [Hylemonella sp.]|uniref:lysophospholipid acyltransferase family protein n=1 Tax=Hylemonella sp. TaxID=2066020 RepID=UPI0022CBA8D3|nr:lysophospholipid acyltransferase family protein [Hylemonella sp.]MCZ8251446.1 lysophospholipid acyltransferase family protein [Hylemonella sp.]
MMDRALVRLLWRGYEMLAMVLGLGLLALGCVLSLPLFLLLLGLPSPLQRRVARHIIRTGFSLYLRLLQRLCQVRLDLQELEALRHIRQPLIVVANHPSLLDAVLLLSVLPNASCVLKAGLLHNPLFGMGARMAGYVSNEDARQMILDSTRSLQEGAQFILFPEGTRTTDFPLNPLSSACVLLSKQSRVPLQTVILEFSTPYLGKHWGLLRPPELPLSIRARLGRRFEPPEYTATALAELEACFRQALDSSSDRR